MTTTDAAEVAAPAEGPAPVPPAVGETITAEQAEALPEGQRAYTMADGSLVVIDDVAPLPTAVFNDIAAPILEIATGFGPGGAQQAQSDLRAAAVAKAAEAATYNRTIWIVVPIHGIEGEFWTFIKSDGKSGTGLLPAINARRAARDRLSARRRRRGAARRDRPPSRTVLT